MARAQDEADLERCAFLAPSTLFRRVDRWRGRQEPLPNRSEAVRQLIEKALEKEEAAQAA